MGDRQMHKNKNKKNQNLMPNVGLKNIKSSYILSKISTNLRIQKFLSVIKYNKSLQNKLNLNIKDYQEYSEIEIELIPYPFKYGEFININKKEKLYYHIYFNDNKKEIKNKYKISKNDKITKIKIIIDYQVNSFEKLFTCIYCIQSILLI